MLEELNTAVDEELVPLVPEEVGMGQFSNIEFDPMHMFIKESSGVSHDSLVTVDFGKVFIKIKSNYIWAFKLEKIKGLYSGD